MSDTSRPQLLRALADGVGQIGLDLEAAILERLLDYLLQLHKWNQAFNLSGIKQLDAMVNLHLLDSLVLAPFINAETIADVGTGAGLPGFPLALCFPEKRFILIDSNSKKTRFIFQTAALLGVHNITVIHSRVEDYASPAQVDIVTSRAFASLADFVQGCRHLLSAQGSFLAMKGLYPAAEIDELPAGFQVSAAHNVKVPGVPAERHILEIRRS
ncbi:MAG: 16S rRNA (guanine(527)-N(7))-methyltransferase RsmG [Pseudohongiellaceae bacterium]